MLKHFDHLSIRGRANGRDRARPACELDDKLGDRHLQLIVSVGKELEPWLNGN
jgi:hypothetical protein